MRWAEAANNKHTRKRTIIKNQKHVDEIEVLSSEDVHVGMEWKGLPTLHQRPIRKTFEKANPTVRLIKDNKVGRLLGIVGLARYNSKPRPPTHPRKGRSMLRKVSSRDLLVIENAEDIDPTTEYAHDRGFRNDYELQHVIANTYKLVNFHRTLVFECLQQGDTWTYRDIEDVVDDEYYYVNASEHTSPELALQAYSYPEEARGWGTMSTKSMVIS